MLSSENIETTMGSGARPRIRQSARKQGFAADDILHALRNHVDLFEDQGAHELVIFIGPAHDGTLLEVGVIEDEFQDRVVHAMRARKKYWPPRDR